MSYDWRRAYRAKTGMPDPRLLGDVARISSCPHCGLAVLVGMDDRAMAIPAVVEPMAVGPLEEARAALDGLRTYRLVGPGGRWQISERNIPGVSWNGITLRSADEVLVVVEHVCGRWRGQRRLPWPARSSRIESSGEPPF
jgi:hypothetical protein